MAAPPEQPDAAVTADEPACWSWALPPEEEDGYGWLLSFHGGRCAVCGRDPRSYADQLVEDHCHRTGQVRGWLCRSCNVREGRGSNRAVRRYRAWHPAAILDVHEPYDGIRWVDGWSLLEHGAAARTLGVRPPEPWPPFRDAD